MQKKFNAILFDLGGVLYDIDIQRSVKAFAALGLPRFDELYSFKEQVALFDGLEIGQATEADFVKQIQRLAEIDIPADKIIAAWNALLIGVPAEVVEILRRLRKDFRIYLLSNTNAIHMQYINRYMQAEHGISDLKDLFDQAFISFEIGMRKPHAAIYTHVLEQAGIAAQDILFIDDSKDNLKGAEAVGIQTLWKDRSQPLKDLMASHEILRQYV